ncbi:MAG: sigma-70 family RNA polymerase sigma factor [Anaerolineales bacterium]
MTVTTDEINRDNARSQIDQTAFEAAFHQHWPKVYGVIFRLVGERAEAEDLALEAFWRLYRRAPRLILDGNLGGWLYRVATNLGFNALRARRRRKDYEQQAGKWTLENSAGPDPSLEAERNEERKKVRIALGRMKPRSARLLVLRHSGLSYAELAEVLKVAPSSIGTMLARAEEQFEEHYRRLEGD